MPLSEAELMSECSPLYPSFALESFANLCLGFFFLYLSVLITGKGKLKTPARDTVLFTWDVARQRFKDVMSSVNQWQDMKTLPLEKRFKFCRKVNASICHVSALVSFLAVTRWLHINNINGFRYLGYSVTCPPMQAELLALIAPVVPCYRFSVISSSFVTFVMLITGWIASCIDDEVWNGDLLDWMEGTGDLDLTPKGWMTVISCLALLYLVMIQLPLVLILYLVHRKRDDVVLPEGFPRVIILVWVTWLMFPIWWSISYEGFKLIDDTKMNGIGFVLLNVISKGGFTLSILRMVRLHKDKGLIPQISTSNVVDGGSTFGTAPRHGGTNSGDLGSASTGSRPMCQALSQGSGDAWFLSVLGKYEMNRHQQLGGAGAAGPSGNSAAVASFALAAAAPGGGGGGGGEVPSSRHATAPRGGPFSAAPVVGAPLDASLQEAMLGSCSVELIMREMLRRIAAGEVALVPTGAAASNSPQTAALQAEEEAPKSVLVEEPKMMNV